MRRRAGLAAAALALLVFHVDRAEARLLNIGGSLDLTYGHTDTRQPQSRGNPLCGQNGEGCSFQTDMLQQRYSIHNYGDLFDPRLGSFTLTYTFLTQNADTSGGSDDRRFNFNDFSLSTNLLPYSHLPLSLYYQWVMRENESGTFGGDQVRTFGANWSLNFPQAPRLSVSFNRSELRATDRTRFPDTVTNFIDFDSSVRAGNTNVTGGVQFNGVKIEPAELEGTTVARGDGTTDRFSGYGVNLNTQTQFTPALSVSTLGRYSDQGGVNAPGFTFFQDRGFTLNVFYIPGLHWDNNFRYDYLSVPDNFAFRRQMVLDNFSIHPTKEFDILTSLRYFTMDAASTDTKSIFGDLSFNYRPFFGLSTGLGGSWGKTDVANDIDMESFFARYRAYINYVQTLAILRFSSSYGVTYAYNDMDRSSAVGSLSGEDSYDLIQNVTFGVENTNIRILHAAMTYAFNWIKRSGETVQPTDDQTSHTITLNLDSSLPRNIIARGDNLQLFAGGALSLIRGFGVEGNSYILDGRATYLFRGLSVAGTYTHQGFPEGFYVDMDLITEQIQYTLFVSDLSLTFLGRGSQQWNSQGGDRIGRETFEGAVLTGVLIGRLSMNLDYRIVEDRSAGTLFLTQSIFARASRFF